MNQFCGPKNVLGFRCLLLSICEGVLFLKLQSVLKSGVLHSTILKPVKSLQASLYFQWLKWIFSTIGCTRDIFVVNMDETSIQNEYACRKG